MTAVDENVLKVLARKYVWWKTPDEAVAFPKRIMAQVMNMGDYDDALLLVTHFGGDILREVLTQAEAGQFNARSWNYWHYRLGLAEPEKVPPMPERRVA